MVRVGAKRRLDFDKANDAPKPSKSPLGKRKQSSNNVAKNIDSSRSSKRSRVTAIPYQTPESITKVLKAISTAKSNHQKTNANKSPKSVPASIKSSIGKSNTNKKSMKRISPKSKTVKKAKAKPSSKILKKPINSKAAKVLTVKKKKAPTTSKTPTKSKSDKVKKITTANKVKSSKKLKKETPTNDDQKLVGNKKRKSKKESLNPNTNVSEYKNDPTFQSNLEIPYISTLAHSRLVFRAVMMNDCKLLKTLVTTDASQIYSLCLPRFPMGDDSNALDFAIKLQNKNVIKMLLELDPSAEKKFGPCPDLLIHTESTGHGSRMMFGHGLRAVTVGRGGKEGHAALLKDDSTYNIQDRIPNKSDFAGHVVRGIEEGLPYSMVEFLLSIHKDKDSSIMNELLNKIDTIVRHGNVEVAGKLAANALKHGGYGFNFLHVESLTNSTEPFSDFKPVSVVKKSMFGSRFTPIHCAAINPNPDYLKALLHSKPEYGIVDRQNWTPVHYAAVCIGDGPLKLLLASGVSTLVTEKDGNTPLHLAVSRRRLHNVKAILAHELQSASNIDATTSDTAIQATSSLEKVNRNGMRPLAIAAKIGHLEIVKALLQANADPEKPTPAQHDKMTALMLACLYGHLDVVKLLVNHGVKVAVTDRRGRTCVFHAVINGHAHILSYLLRLGVNHQVQDSSGNSLAHYAAAYGWFFALKLLLEAGCDVAKGNDWKLTPLAIAFMKGHVGIVELLVKEPGVEVNTPVDGDSGMTLLLKACSSTTMKSSLIPRLKFLIEELRADCTTPDFKGNNALHHLAGLTLCKEWEDFSMMFNNLSQAATFLIDRGCNLNAVNLKNESPIMIACANKNYWLAEKFLDSGVKLNTLVDSEDEDTILHKLVGSVKSQYVQHLYEKLAKDADNLKALKTMAQMKNKENLTPLFKIFTDNKTTHDANEVKNICNFVSFLVKKLDSDVNAVRMQNKVQTSILHSAVCTSYATQVLPILQLKKLDLDPLDINFRTPLATLIVTNKNNSSSTELTSYLINAGANINFKSKSDDSLSLLLLLAMHQPKMFSLIPQMLEKGGDFREVDPKLGNSTLHFVSQNPKETGALEAVVALIKSGSNVNLSNKDGRTPLHLVVNARGNETDVAYDIEDVLLTAGADLRLRDVRHRTSLHYAFVKIGKPLEKSNLDPIELVMILLNAIRGTNKREFVKIADKFGATPLHYAAMRGATICCSYFSSEMKDNMDIKDLRGNTPFGLAVWCGHEGSSLHFQQQGADFLQILDTNIQIIKEPAVDSCNEIMDIDDDDKSNSELDDNSSDNDSNDNSDDHNGESMSTSRGRNFKGVSIEPSEETLLIWSHRAKQDDEIRRMRTEAMKYPIFQEVVKKEWQGILHLMIAKLQSSGANISIPVSTAIKTQKLRLALKLVHRVKDVKELEQNQETLLHTLAKHSKAGDQSELQVQLLNLLVEKGVDPKQGDSLNCNAISYAAMNQNHAQVAALEKVGITAQSIPQLPRDHLGRTPFSALFWKLNEFVNISHELTLWAASLLTEGTVSANVLTQYPFILSPYPGVRCLVKYPDHRDSKSFPLYSPLIVAAIHGRYNVVNWLWRLKSSVNFNFGDDQGRTAMMHAVRLNDLKMVKLLLNPHSYKSELDTDPWNNNYSNWVRGKSSELSLDVQDKRGWTAVDHLVCPSVGDNPEESYYYANVEQILLILHKAGASFTKKSGDGKSPLERAAELKKTQVVNAMYKILKTPQTQQFSSPEDYGTVVTIPKNCSFEPPIKDFIEKAKQISLDKEAKMPQKELKVLPDPLLDMEQDNSEVVFDPVQDILFDVVLTNVDLSYGMYGLYNFYKMQVVKQPRGKQLVVLFTQWGRVGTEGQYQKTPFPSEEEAIKEFKKIFKAKSGNNWDDGKNNFKPIPKRYRLVHKDIKAKRPAELTVDFEELEKCEKLKPSKLNTEVYKIIRSCTMVHKMEMSSNHNQSYRNAQTSLEVSKSLPIISTEALHKANEVLNRIKVILAEKHKMQYNHATENYTEEQRLKIFEQLIAASEEFYALVPVYGFASEALQPIFELSNLHERQEEIYSLVHLGFAKELILAAEYSSPTTNPIEYIYQCLGTKLAPLDMAKKSEHFEGQLILQYIHNTSPKTKVEGIYRIQGAEEHEITVSNRWLLWHGTKKENILSILHSGLQIAPLGVDRMGELFGKGIYFADTFEKSEGYTSNYHHRQQKSSKFIFLCEVALGKIKDVRINSNDVSNHTPGTERSLQKGFDSSKTADSRYIPDPGATVFWNGKSIPLGSKVEQVFPKNQYYGLNYNEYIIFNPKQVKLRYLVQFT